MTAVDEDCELYGAGPADVAQRVQSGADCPSGIEHIVDEDDQGVVDAALGYRRVFQRPRRLEVEVVAVERDVQRPVRKRDAGELFDLVGEPRGEGDAPGRDAEGPSRAVFSMI